MKKTIIMIIASGIICIVVVILQIQESLFFYPWHDENSYNMLLKEPNFENVEINSNGNILNGWIKYNENKSKKEPLLIFFYGNAWNSSNACMTFLKNDIYRHFEGYNFLVIDYPGYGLSEGSLSDKTMFKSAIDIYDFAIKLDCVDKDNIVVMGYSIGTGVATYLSSQRAVNGLILVSPYDEALSLYNDNLNIFHGPLKLLAKYKFNSKEYAKSVQVSPLIITSYADEIIDYRFSLNLSNYFNDVDDIVILDDVTHNYYYEEEIVLESINDYLKNRLEL